MTAKETALHLEVAVADDRRCAHCAVMRALAEFSHKRRGGEMEAGEAMFALATALAELLDTAPDAEVRREMEDEALAQLERRGLRLMRIEGPTQ